MDKIPDEFSGYLKIGDDTLTYYASDSIITMLPANHNRNDTNDVYERISSRNTTTPEYIIGEYSGHLIAFYRNNNFFYDWLGLNRSIKFASPLIIMTDGNTSSFNECLSEKWNKFHSITFYGGNINSIFPPYFAVDKQDVDTFPKEDGSRVVKILPWDKYSRSIEIEIGGEKVELTVSVSQSDGNSDKSNLEGYNLGRLMSFIRLTFENAQDFDQIAKYYDIVKSLISILTGQVNVCFDVALSQKVYDDLLCKTAHCKIFDHYDNYSSKKEYQVIPILDIIEGLPHLINIIEKGDANPLLTLLPDNNKNRNMISITNVQDICTALEIAYKWNRDKRAKDKLVVDLKSEIKKTIDTFIELHPEVDVDRQTTISSSFQYLDFTLKQKIYTLYCENKRVIDYISDKHRLPQLTEEGIAAFVKLRNDKTHSGKIEFGDSALLYNPLLALTYTCLLKYAEIPDEKIGLVINQIF